MTTEVALVPDMAPEMEEAARRIAEDEQRWFRGRLRLSWDAMWLQAAGGKSQADVARQFEVCHSTLSRKPPPPHWAGVTRTMLPWIARLVRRAIAIRCELMRVPPAEAWDEAQCDIAGVCLDEAPPSLEALLAFAPLPPELCPEPQPSGPRWEDIAHAAQLAPERPWRVWMMMGGRGAGKTRAGAEWVRAMVESGVVKRIALVGPTLHDVREVMIGGPSGLCAVGDARMRPTYEVTRRRLVWPKCGPCAGAVAFAFSAEDPDSLRGPQFDAAWCDEIGAWAYDLKTWQTLAFGMRLGGNPRIVATTTPRPRALVRMLVEKAERARGGVVLTQASTRANAENLAPEFVRALEEDYGGTEVGRQELDGELIEDMAGAIFSRALIEQSRARAEEAVGFEQVVVAVDPPAGASARSDACGIIVAGVKDGVVFVLADATTRGLRPAGWAGRTVAAALAHGAGLIVAEGNQGGEMVRDVLVGAAEGRVKVKLRHAKESKRDRAIPVSALYETGRVRHVRVLKELEDEMCAFGAEQQVTPGQQARSPDRVDALVWAVRELTTRRVLPRVDALEVRRRV